MKFNSMLCYYLNQIFYDLLYKFNYLNNYELPKIKQITLYNTNSFIKKKAILTYLIKILLLSNQKSQALITKKLNLKYEIKKLSVNLNKENTYFFLEKIIYMYFPLVTNIKKFTINFFKNGNFLYKFNNINLLGNKNILKLTGFTSIINMNLVTTSKNNLICILLLNLFFFPLK